MTQTNSKGSITDGFRTVRLFHLYGRMRKAEEKAGARTAERNRSRKTKIDLVRL